MSAQHATLLQHHQHASSRRRPRCRRRELLLLAAAPVFAKPNRDASFSRGRPSSLLVVGPRRRQSGDKKHRHRYTTASHAKSWVQAYILRPLSHRAFVASSQAGGEGGRTIHHRRSLEPAAVTPACRGRPMKKTTCAPFHATAQLKILLSRQVRLHKNVPITGARAIGGVSPCSLPAEIACFLLAQKT